MILTAINHMLSTGEQWNPSVLYKIDMPAPLLEKQKVIAFKCVNLCSMELKALGRFRHKTE